MLEMKKTNVSVSYDQMCSIVKYSPVMRKMEVHLARIEISLEEKNQPGAPTKCSDLAARKYHWFIHSDGVNRRIPVN